MRHAVRYDIFGDMNVTAYSLEGSSDWVSADLATFKILDAQYGSDVRLWQHPMGLRVVTEINVTRDLYLPPRTRVSLFATAEFGKQSADGQVGISATDRNDNALWKAYTKHKWLKLVDKKEFFINPFLHNDRAYYELVRSFYIYEGVSPNKLTRILWEVDTVTQLNPPTFPIVVTFFLVSSKALVTESDEVYDLSKLFADPKPRPRVRSLSV